VGPVGESMPDVCATSGATRELTAPPTPHPLHCLRCAVRRFASAPCCSLTSGPASCVSAGQQTESRLFGGTLDVTRNIEYGSRHADGINAEGASPFLLLEPPLTYGAVRSLPCVGRITGSRLQGQGRSWVETRVLTQVWGGGQGLSTFNVTVRVGGQKPVQVQRSRRARTSSSLSWWRRPEYCREALRCRGELTCSKKQKFRKQTCCKRNSFWYKT